MSFSAIIKYINSIFSAPGVGEHFAAQLSGSWSLSRCGLGAPAELVRVALGLQCSSCFRSFTHLRLRKVRQKVTWPVQGLPVGALNIQLVGGRWSFVGHVGQRQMFKLGFHPAGLVACVTTNSWPVVSCLRHQGLTHRSKGRAAYRQRAPELKR